MLALTDEALDIFVSQGISDVAWSEGMKNLCIEFLSGIEVSLPSDRLEDSLIDICVSSSNSERKVANLRILAKVISSQRLPHIKRE